MHDFFPEQTFLRYTTKYIIIGHPADGDFKQVISQSTIQIKNENRRILEYSQTH